MAEDKKKDGDGKTDGGKRRKGLPPLVMVALGAVAGGAGVVFAVPPKVIEKQVEAKTYEEIDVTHPDVLQHEFNPRTKAGKSMVRVAWKFVYTVREDLEAQAFEQIKANWEQATSNSLLLLKTRSMEELGTEQGILFLEKDLIDNLDRTLFPAGTEKIARVTRVLWQKWLMQ